MMQYRNEDGSDEVSVVTLDRQSLLYRFDNRAMGQEGIVARGGATVIRHLSEGGYGGSGLLSLQEYETEGDFSYARCKTRFGLGRLNVYVTARAVLEAACTVVDFNGAGVVVGTDGRVKFIRAADYHNMQDESGDRYFVRNDNITYNVGEVILAGTIPLECWFRAQVTQFDGIIRSGGRIGWRVGGRYFSVSL